MKKNIFAVCDLEAAYAYNLMEYINIRPNTPFEIQAFTSVKSLAVFLEDHEVELLLISDEAMNEEVRGMKVERIMILSEGEIVKEFEEYPSVYKYQSSDNLIAEVMGFYADEAQEAQPQSLLKERVEFIGFYSPVRRVFQTSFALGMGQILARKKSVLYISMEGYSGFESLMKKQYPMDLSDLVYFMKQDKGNILYKLEGMIQTLNGLDYIPPVFSPLDLRMIQVEEWLKLFGDLIAFSTYEIVILDIGDQIADLFKVLNQCDRIFMPVKEDKIAKAKIGQYEKLVEVWEYEELIRKTRKIKIPFFKELVAGDFNPEQLVWGEMGEFLRQLVTEEELIE